MLFSSPLLKRLVGVTDHRGRRHLIPMPPVRLLEPFYQLLEQTGSDLQAGATGRRHLRDLLLPFFPRPRWRWRRELNRLDYPGMIQLAAYLFFGSPRTGRLNPPGGTDCRNEFDLTIIAAKLLAIYPGYTLKTLLDEPAPVFFELARLAPQIQADRALSELFPGIVAALNGGEALQTLRQAAGEIRESENASAPVTYSESEYQVAVARMHSPDLRKVAHQT